jgi:tRNA A37 threonylcarbamoyladenosine dehydratase
MKERIESINKDCEVITHQVFVTGENISEIIPNDVDYVVDAIDTVSAKLGLAEYCYKNDIKIISSMGTGNKLDPTAFRVVDVFKTKVCPLAKVMRHELRKRGVEKLQVVYSEEMPIKPKFDDVVTCKTGCVCTGGTKKCASKRQIPGSISFVPPVAGMIIGGEVIKGILGIK